MKLKKTITSIPLLLTTLTSQILLHTPVTAQTAPPLLCAVPGKDGPNKNLEGIINTYYPGTGTASRGSNIINVGAKSDSSKPDIAVGDLLLIIQMQGADINSTDTDSYGSNTQGKASGNKDGSEFIAGQYEYVVATSAVPESGGVVSIRGVGSGSGLINSYISTPADNNIRGQRTYQVIRVPQYSDATLTGTLTAAPWNGSSGGVLVYDVAGETKLGNGTVDVSGKGFRGGGGIQKDGGATGLTFRDYVSFSDQPANGSKGEGTAGTPRYLINRADNTLIGNSNTPEGYPGGSFGRGALGNAGGGSTDGDPASPVGRGNDENSGGGGGGNGGTGGIGGNSFFSNLPIGGLGGERFPASSGRGRVVMGGGGGAGTTNNGSGSPIGGIVSSGAPGGGIVLLRTNSVTGTSTINANGENALYYEDGLLTVDEIMNPSRTIRTVTRDGGGGGGAGGSVVVTAANNSLAGLTINANGGFGGSALYRDIPKDSHGPGGGGGGGVILTSSGADARNVNPGESGITLGVDQNGRTVSTQYGATRGNDGITGDAPTIPGANSGAECVPQLTVNKTTNKITNTPRIANKPGKATYTITVSNAIGRAAATQVRITDPLPSGFTYDAATSITITDPSTGALQNVNPTIVPSKGATNLDFGTFDISGGSTLTITFTTDVAENVPDGVYQNGATATYLDPQRTTDTGTNSSTYDPASSPGEDVIVGPIPPPPLNSMRGVKRITNVIRNGVPLADINFGAVVDDPGDINDDASIWANSQLAPVGVTRIDPQLKLRAGDEVEYTVYFLVDGNESITNARFCDPIPQGTSFISNSGSDITLNIANTITNLTNIADADRASLVNAVAPLPANNVCPNQSNPTGAVLVNFGTLDSTPGNNFGYTRFRVRVD